MINPINSSHVREILDTCLVNFGIQTHHCLKKRIPGNVRRSKQARIDKVNREMLVLFADRGYTYLVCENRNTRVVYGNTLMILFK